MKKNLPAFYFLLLWLSFMVGWLVAGMIPERKPTIYIRPGYENLKQGEVMDSSVSPTQFEDWKPLYE